MEVDMFLFGAQPEHNVAGFRYVVEHDPDPDDGTVKLEHFAEHQFDTRIGMRRYKLQGRPYSFLSYENFKEQVLCHHKNSA
tara:strand:- start:353 stop:595 length:243 start_codon:yes stop_codon:yes gene_type:complete